MSTNSGIDKNTLVSNQQENEDDIEVMDEPILEEQVTTPQTVTESGHHCSVQKKIAANLEQIKHLDWQNYHKNNLNIGETYKIMGLLKLAKARLKSQVLNIFAETCQRET